MIRWIHQKGHQTVDHELQNAVQKTITSNSINHSHSTSYTCCEQLQCVYVSIKYTHFTPTISTNSTWWLVTNNGVYFGRMHSPIGLNTQLCCERYSLLLYRFSCINRVDWVFCVQRLEQWSTAGIIYELLLAKSGLGVILSLCVTEIDFIIDYLCVS